MIIRSTLFVVLSLALTRYCRNSHHLLLPQRRLTVTTWSDRVFVCLKLIEQMEVEKFSGRTFHGMIHGLVLIVFESFSRSFSSFIHG